ncbi:hypothetical protein FSHL1_012258 [Fusarium sambucinum]
MACTTFHPFTRLPTEIRLQIWKEVCHERRDEYRTIHYVTIGKGDKIAPLNRNWDNSKPKDKSVYLWSAGLWLACEESREVVYEHWKWNLIPSREGGTPARWPHPNDKHCSQIGDQEDIAKLVIFFRIHYRYWERYNWDYPEKDFFCITTDNETSIRFWVSCNWYHCSSEAPKNIALEFNPSWSIALENGWPGDFFHFDFDWYQNDPLIPIGLPLLRVFIFDRLFRRTHYRDKIKLIDRDAKWVSRDTGLKPTIIDLDDRYIDIPANHHCISRTRLVEGSAILDFLDRFDRAFRQKLLMTFRCIISGLDPEYKPRDSISIFVRWDNRVEC